MHKRFVGVAVVFSFILGLVPSSITGAVGGTVVISEVLTGTAKSGSAEFVRIHNQTNQPVKVGEWKLYYLSAASGEPKLRATLKPNIELAANGYFLLSSENFNTEFGVVGDELLASGMADDGGRLRLLDDKGVLVDALSWGANALPSEGVPAPKPAPGQILFRTIGADDLPKDTNDNSADFALDICVNIDGNQAEVPEGYQPGTANTCTPTPLPIEYSTIRLNEVLPDPGSPKTDAADEFIELYNPNNFPVDVAGYRIMSGSNLSSVFVLPAYTIPAHGYLTLYSSETKIGLSNSGSKLQLQSPDQKPMGDILEYGAAGTDQTWALFADGWKLTDKPTPNLPNELLVETETPGMGGAETGPAPCPAGKYRNPLTNRCRNIETDASVLAACDADEYRSPETNRCRKISLATATVTPCQEGYERNPDTNRCRKIAGDASSLKPCAPGQERNQETNRCRKVAGASTSAKITEPEKKQGLDAMGGIALGAVGLVAVSYGVYEWRSEIGKAFGRMFAGIGKK